jgi:alkaline phosphatase
MAEASALKVGLVTDVHYADADTRGTRFYRESLGKMREAVDALNQRKIDFAVELGDLIDSAQNTTAAVETEFLKEIDGEFGRLQAKRHYVLGNHCVATLTKEQFLNTVEQPRSYYSFDKGGFHFVILDACFRKDGVAYSKGNFAWTDTEIPAEQREWLKADLAATKHKTIVFVHQRLDLPVGNHYAIHSSPAVRQILEESGKALAVFMGHSHKNEYAMMGSVHYVTLAAMVEGSGAANSGYSALNVFADGALKLDGFRKHAEHPWIKP